MSAETVSEDQMSWEMSWWFLAAYAAGRASVIESEGMQTAWSYLLDYATATGDLASECEYAGHPPESVARIRERAAAIRAALEALR